MVGSRAMLFDHCAEFVVARWPSFVAHVSHVDVCIYQIALMHGAVIAFEQMIVSCLLVCVILNLPTLLLRRFDGLRRPHVLVHCRLDFSLLDRWKTRIILRVLKIAWHFSKYLTTL